MISKFLLSAASASDFPRTGLPEVAMVGRSNVGKSSLINALAKKSIARTSAAPGKTRLANYYLMESAVSTPGAMPSFYLVDLPGYGYARGGRESAEQFEALAAQYFDPSSAPMRRLAGVLHCVDSRHPGLPQDLKAHTWVLRTGADVVVVATKVDKLSRAERQRALRALESEYDCPVLAESASAYEGIDTIWKTLRGWVG